MEFVKKYKEVKLDRSTIKVDPSIVIDDLIVGSKLDVFCLVFNVFSRATVLEIKDKKIFTFGYDKWPDERNNVTFNLPSFRVQKYESQIDTKRYDYVPKEVFI